MTPFKMQLIYVLMELPTTQIFIFPIG
jgi:hypothetical protein